MPAEQYRLVIALDVTADPLDLQQQALLLAERMAEEGSPVEGPVMAGADPRVALYLAASQMLGTFERALPSARVANFSPQVE